MIVKPWDELLARLQVACKRRDIAALVGMVDSFRDEVNRVVILMDDDSPNELIQFGLPAAVAGFLAKRGWTIGKIRSRGPLGLKYDGVKNPGRVMDALMRAKQAEG